MEVEPSFSTAHKVASSSSARFAILIVVVLFVFATIAVAIIITDYLNRRSKRTSTPAAPAAAAAPTPAAPAPVPEPPKVDEAAEKRKKGLEDILRLTEANKSLKSQIALDERTVREAENERFLAQAATIAAPEPKPSGSLPVFHEPFSVKPPAPEPAPQQPKPRQPAPEPAPVPAPVPAEQSLNGYDDAYSFDYFTEQTQEPHITSQELFGGSPVQDVTFMIQSWNDQVVVQMTMDEISDALLKGPASPVLNSPKIVEIEDEGEFEIPKSSKSAKKRR